jgi:hypothetical protein
MASETALHGLDGPLVPTSKYLTAAEYLGMRLKVRGRRAALARPRACRCRDAPRPALPDRPGPTPLAGGGRASRLGHPRLRGPPAPAPGPANAAAPRAPHRTLPRSSG